MAKEHLTREQLLEKSTQLTGEIETLRSVINASNTTVFDLLINEVKKAMQNNIAEEEWKILKENQKKVENYRSIEKAIQNQTELLERKEDELEDVKWQLSHYQPSLFDQEQLEPEETGYFSNRCKKNIMVGDIYESSGEQDDEDNYFLVKKSSEIDGSFAIISNSLDSELLLQYPNNLKILESDDIYYYGNIYENDELQSQALEALKLIADSQETAEHEKSQND